MKIALIGYGRMGRAIERLALGRGHRIGLIIDESNPDDLNRAKLAGIDVAIEFTVPSAALHNVKVCIEAGVPVVSGTTGWGSGIAEIEELCRDGRAAFLHASNFSIGVNILFHLNSRLAELMSQFDEYRVGVTETHHTRKLDAPSGTAITLAAGISEAHKRYSGWKPVGEASEGDIPVLSVREGDVPGTHLVKWSCSHDEITLTHEAFSREGFATGAMMAAEFVKGKRGFLTMRDMLGF